MKMRFKDLDIGDMFNTKIARFVKTDDNKALVVMGPRTMIGSFGYFDSDDDDFILLYSKKVKENVQE